MNAKLAVVAWSVLLDVSISALNAFLPVRDGPFPLNLTSNSVSIFSSNVFTSFRFILF